MASDDDGAERPHRRRRHRRSRRRPELEGNRLAAAIAVGVVVVLFVAGGWYYYSRNSPTESALRELRALPLVRAVMADLRRQYILPALRSADHASALAAVAARGALAGFRRRQCQEQRTV